MERRYITEQQFDLLTRALGVIPVQGPQLCEAMGAAYAVLKQVADQKVEPQPESPENAELPDPA